ncbi:uncharacterized protein LOC128207565 isoform X2 [Mya arenaria]|uniref:uncharacterized protein LOC128207565 isoform X2 n=1 Tax=Mya arenaria TaxID=6604 RepID=UPI0022E7E7B0|nr:uncharacterized protein LOC128207565 isoform X2 [Mya arenaria]
MSTFLCVLLLGVILVASVQGLTKDQLQQILENGKGSATEDDVDVEDILEQLGFQEKTDVDNDDDDDDEEDMKRVGWNWASRQLKSKNVNKKRVGWNWPTRRLNSQKDNMKHAGLNLPARGENSKTDKDVGWWTGANVNTKRDGSNLLAGGEKSKKDDRLGWWFSPGAPAADDVKPKATEDIVIELPGFWWIPKGNNVKDPAPWCQSHSSGASCCVQRTMHVRGKKYHLNACVNVDYHPHVNEYSVYFSVNGYSLFHKDTDLNMNEVEECFSASSLVPGSKICIKLYKICTKHKHMCAALEGKAVIKGVEKNVKLDYGCFQIGSGDENDDAQVPDGMETEEQATKAEMFRALSAQLDLSDGGEETSSIEDDTLRFEN